MSSRYDEVAMQRSVAKVLAVAVVEALGLEEGG